MKFLSSRPEARKEPVEAIYAWSSQILIIASLLISGHIISIQIIIKQIAFIV
jgi:hypothetical protein